MITHHEVSGKTTLVTGATDGLGKLVASHLAQHKAVLLLHGRSEEKGKSLIDEIYQKTQHDKVQYYNGDYSSLQDVKELSRKILSDHDHIDILINNVGIGAGVSQKKREVSKDGIELRFAVNYLSHVLLTEKLLPIISPGSRIINVASVGQEPIDFENLMLEANYDGFFAYKQSKTSLIMYTFDLADRLGNKNIKVNAIHPASLMNTKMVLESWKHTLSTVEQGAEAVESIILTEATGAYFDGKRQSKAIPQTYDIHARSMLKQITWKLLENFL